MGISKQAFVEASRREELSAESLAPIKETLLKVAREKNPAYFGQIDATRFTAILSEYMSRKVVKNLLDKGILRHATSTRLRNVDEEIRNCCSPTTTQFLPDRMLREMVSDTWKNEAGDPFAHNAQVIKTLPGARADSHGRAFTMFVQDTPAVRRYLRYFNKRSSPFVGLSYLPVFFTKETFISRGIIPSSNGGSRYGTGLSHIRERDRLSDATVNFLTNRIFLEFHAQVMKFKTLRSVNTYYHQTHTMGMLVNNARDTVVNSIFPANALRTRNNNPDVTPAVMITNDFMRVLRNLPAGTPSPTIMGAESEEGAMIVRVINSIALELQRTMEPMFNDIYTEMRATNPDMNKVPGFNDLLTWGPRSGNKFLFVTLDFIINTNNRDKFNRSSSKVLASALGRFSDKSLAQTTFALTGVDVGACFATRPTDIPRGLTQAYDEVKVELINTKLGQETTASRAYTQLMFHNFSIMDDHVLEKAASDVMNAFNALLRKNIWLSLL